jgi:hypothetical protein
MLPLKLLFCVAGKLGRPQKATARCRLGNLRRAVDRHQFHRVFGVYCTSTDSGNQSCPEASIPDLAVRIIRLFEQFSLGLSESNLTVVFPF